MHKFTFLGFQPAILPRMKKPATRGGLGAGGGAVCMAVLGDFSAIQNGALGQHRNLLVEGIQLRLDIGNLIIEIFNVAVVLILVLLALMHLVCGEGVTSLIAAIAENIDLLRQNNPLTVDF